MLHHLLIYFALFIIIYSFCKKLKFKKIITILLFLLFFTFIFVIESYILNISYNIQQILFGFLGIIIGVFLLINLYIRKRNKISKKD